MEWFDDFREGRRIGTSLTQGSVRGILCLQLNPFLAYRSFYVLGSFYVEWLDDFREGRGLTSWIAATQHSAMHLVGMYFSQC